ncbi:MAG: hypothetical protein V4596_09510 [Bdellovibrionota bacterium]
MKKLIFILITVLFLNVQAQTKPLAVLEPTDLAISRNCRKAEKACVSMELDTVDKSLIVDRKPVNGETEYTLKVFGKLEKEAEKEHILKFIGGGDEKGCTVFGRGTAAVMGFSPMGNPIVLTDRGNLELTSKLITMGASNIQMVNLNSLKREAYLSKSQDMTPAAISRIHFDSSGDLYFIDGTECFEFRKKEAFRKVDIKKCESKKIEMKDTSKLEKIRLKSDQEVYEIKDVPYIMIIEKTTC